VRRAAGIGLLEEVDAEVGVALALCFLDEVVSGLARLGGIRPGELVGLRQFVWPGVRVREAGLLPAKGDEVALSSAIVEEMPEKHFGPACSLVQLDQILSSPSAQPGQSGRWGFCFATSRGSLAYSRIQGKCMAALY